MRRPDARGYFGEFGGSFVPEVLVAALQELESAMEGAFAHPEFWDEYHRLLRDFVGRPSPIMEAERLCGDPSAARLVFKREDLNHTGAHKINNTVGQGLLAKRMGKRRIIAETGAGQHGVATATIGAKLGIPVEVFMGALDVERQSLNVYVMKLLGARVHPVTSGTQTLKDATNEALSRLGRPHRRYVLLHRQRRRRAPVPLHGARVSKGDRRRSARPAARTLRPFAERRRRLCRRRQQRDGDLRRLRRRRRRRLWGVEAAGHGIGAPDTAASLGAGSIGVLHGSRSYLLQTAQGQVRNTHSISAGLDYPGVGPEHAFLKASGRAVYVSADDDEALAAFHRCAEREGIVPALESAHALAFAERLARERGREGLVLVNLSGRGDKDTRQVEALESARLAGAQ